MNADAPLTLEDMLAAARAVARAAAAIPGADRTRLAWVIRNRAREGLRRRHACGRPHPRYGSGTVAAAAASLLAEWPAARSPAREILRAAAAICCVWAGDAPDAAGGSTDPVAAMVAGEGLEPSTSGL